MRSINFAPSFDDELIHISAYVESQFGLSAAEEFEDRLKRIARTLASEPLIGTRDHGYPTKLYGFVLPPNWIFYRFTEDQITFLHIRSTRMRKKNQEFRK